MVVRFRRRLTEESGSLWRPAGSPTETGSARGAPLCRRRLCRRLIGRRARARRRSFDLCRARAWAAPVPRALRAAGRAGMPSSALTARRCSRIDVLLRAAWRPSAAARRRGVRPSARRGRPEAVSPRGKRGVSDVFGDRCRRHSLEWLIGATPGLRQAGACTVWIGLRRADPQACACVTRHAGKAAAALFRRRDGQAEARAPIDEELSAARAKRARDPAARCERRLAERERWARRFAAVRRSGERSPAYRRGDRL